MPGSLAREIEVRWGDLDALNHVNNTAFLRYLEEVRVRWFDTLPGHWKGEEFGPVVVNINCNFRREIRYPATVRVTLRARLASERRVVLEHAICDAEDPDTLYADAQITVVWIDRRTQRSIPVPAGVCEALHDE